MKLNYSATRTITTADLFDACDPPLIFEVRSKPGREWARLDRKFDDTGNSDIDIARTLIALTFLSVSDGENTYPITSVPQVEDFRLAIEELNPGGGDEFILAIAWGFGVNHYDFLSKNLGNSPRPLAQLDSNGQKVSEQVTAS